MPAWIIGTSRRFRRDPDFEKQCTTESVVAGLNWASPTNSRTSLLSKTRKHSSAKVRRPRIERGSFSAAERKIHQGRRKPGRSHPYYRREWLAASGNP